MREDAMPMPPPDAVYVHPDGSTYVALFTSDDSDRSGWFRWPAAKRGWSYRERAANADDCCELPSRLARLALQLSGVPTDDR
jgi:hypothetical protein